MAKKAAVYRMTGPGRVLDRSVKKGKLTVEVDASPDGFITECRRDNGRLTLKIAAAKTGIDPIQIILEPKTWCLKFEDASIPKDRLADLEFLITEEADVQITLEYTPEPKLTGDAGLGSDD